MGLLYGAVLSWTLGVDALLWAPRSGAFWPRGRARSALRSTRGGAAPAAPEVLEWSGDDVVAPVSEALAGVFRVAHCEGGDAAYVVARGGEESGGGCVVVGVPAAEALDEIKRTCGDVRTWFLPHRVADGAAQAAVRAAFPGARRVVHRMDAGRGAYRHDDDVLLSGAGKRAKFRVADAGKTTTRRRDDGPWELAPGLRAMWVPGPSQGACVLRVETAAGAAALFSGAAAGYDARVGAVSPFALEDDHSAAEHATSLRALAGADEAWDFTFLLPSRGAAVEFPDASAARAALRAAAAQAEAMAERGA